MPGARLALRVQLPSLLNIVHHLSLRRTSHILRYLIVATATGLIFFFHYSRVVQYTRSVTGCQTDDCLWRILRARHCLSVCDMSAIVPYPPHLYKCLWHHYFRTSNIVTLVSPVYLFLFAGHHGLSQTITAFGDPLLIGCIGHVCIIPINLHIGS